MTNSPVAVMRDEPDDKQAEHGRERHEGFRIYKHSFQQPAPLFFTQDSHPLWLGDIYRGRSAFLIASGPSFAALDHSKLRQPGIVTLGLNNSPRTFRPNMWCSVDSPDHWIRSIWEDPLIQKFVPLSHAKKRIFDSNRWQFTGEKVADCPNVVYYKRNEHFQAKQFLWEDCFNWGNHKDHGGGRSVMLPAIRILFTLGFRRAYLLGVDFNMTPQTTYHFDQRRHPGSVAGNNSTYQKLNQWFKELRPLFERENFTVLNCNRDSGLKAFDYISFDEAVKEARIEAAGNERTRNLYDTETREKEEGVGKDLTWYRVNAPKGVKKCRYCRKKCVRASADEREGGKVQLLTNCEQSRKALWQKKGKRYVGNLKDVGTLLLSVEEAVADFNKRFGRDEK